MDIILKKHKIKSYLTLNTIIYDSEIKKIEEIIKKANPQNIFFENFKEYTAAAKIIQFTAKT